MTMKLEYKNGPYGLDKITADDGTVFYLNSNGVFDTLSLIHISEPTRRS